ncbi:MAG TPA: pyruvate-binding protein [Burkholderiaceae bacterium]
MKIRTLAAAATMALAATTGAHAATVWSDNFDADARGLNAVPAGWTVANAGTVDVIGTGFFDEIPGNGNYIDLDGSNGVAGLLTRGASVGAGTYTATFSLGGNHRDGSTDLVTVNFGGSSQTFSVGPNDAFTTYSLTTAAAAGDLSLSFVDGRNGNIGALLDNITVASAVPEADSAVLLGLGLAAVGMARRRRA